MADLNSEDRKQALFDAVLSLRSREEVRKFFIDLCTPAELEAMADRWQVAQLLSEGMPYREINQRTGVSTATVTRVARSLIYGEGGYRHVLKTGVSHDIKSNT